MVTPRSSHVGDNSTVVGAGFGDPAAVIEANDADTRISDFLAALRRPWWDEASCRGMDPELFHNAKRKREALAVCGACPVMLPCRDEAVADPSLDHGIRGGMDVAARRNARRLQRTQPTDRTTGGGAPADVEPTTHPSDPAPSFSLPSVFPEQTTDAGGGLHLTPRTHDRSGGGSQCGPLSFTNPPKEPNR